MTGSVDHEVSVDEFCRNGSGAVGLGHGSVLDPAQERLHAQDELARAERLRHVVVRTDLQAEDPIGLLPRAVSMMTGSPGWTRRSCRHTSSPSGPGSMRSSRTTSVGGPLRRPARRDRRPRHRRPSRRARDRRPRLRRPSSRRRSRAPEARPQDRAGPAAGPCSSDRSPSASRPCKDRVTTRSWSPRQSRR